MSKKYTVLVVDDEPGFRQTLSDILELKGYASIALEQGQRALAQLDSIQPAVALVDLKLDDMSGLELIKQIKNKSSGVECILLTGHASQDSAIQAVNLGAYGYMQKPYDIEQLLVMIRRAIEKREAEEALRISEERLRQVLDSISDHIYMSEVTAEGHYINHYMSPNVETLTGYTIEKLLANWHFWPSEIIHPADLDIAESQAERLKVGRDSEAEYRLIRADGQVIWVRDSARVEDKSASTIIYGVVSDITKHKQLEEQLRQVQKMEAIGRLAGGVAHDFNNILTVIIGNCDLIMSQLDSASPLHKDIEQIQKSGIRAAELTSQLLAFSRKQILQLRELDLNSVIAGIENLLHRTIGENIQLAIELDNQLQPIRADPVQLEQILLNLVLNARDAMPDGGKLTVETAPVYLDAAYARQHVEVTPGPHMMLAVTDTGAGMDKETQSHIFEPFFTTKEPGKGTGLGLATIHGIVKQSRGHIWVYSELGQGTSFRVYWPQADKSVQSVEHEPDAGETPRRTGTILLVEDEILVRELAHRVLLMCGYNVLVATTSEEALELSTAFSAPIDLLLADMMMSGSLSGRQLAERMIIERPRIKVIYISDFADEAIIHHGTLNRDFDFLQKPFTSDILLKMVQQVLDNH